MFIVFGYTHGICIIAYIQTGGYSHVYVLFYACTFPSFVWSMYFYTFYTSIIFI